MTTYAIGKERPGVPSLGIGAYSGREAAGQTGAHAYETQTAPASSCGGTSFDQAGLSLACAGVALLILGLVAQTRLVTGLSVTRRTGGCPTPAVLVLRLMPSALGTGIMLGLLTAYVIVTWL